MHLVPVGQPSAGSVPHGTTAHARTQDPAPADTFAATVSTHFAGPGTAVLRPGLEVLHPLQPLPHVRADGSH